MKLRIRINSSGIQISNIKLPVIFKVTSHDSEILSIEYFCG